MRWIIDHMEAIKSTYKQRVFNSRKNKFTTQYIENDSGYIIYFKLKCEYENSRKGSKYLGFYLCGDDILKTNNINDFERVIKDFLYASVTEFIKLMPTYINENEFKRGKTNDEFYGNVSDITNALYFRKIEIFIKIFNRIITEHSLKNINDDIRIKEFVKRKKRKLPSIETLLRGSLKDFQKSFHESLKIKPL